MDRDEVIATLSDHTVQRRGVGIAHWYLFGSAARDEEQLSSDVYLFFDFDDSRVSLTEQLRLRDRAREILHGWPDAMHRRSLHPQFRAEAEPGVLPVL